MSRQVFHVESGYGYGVVGADLHVFADRGPVYLLAEYRSTALPAGRRVPPGQPSRLLNSRYEVVDFTGREHERAALAAWRDADEELSVLWLHGPGGQGKSRLAARVATESAAAGWKVVTATHGPGSIVPSPGSHDVRPGPDARGLLLIVDYADRWPLTHLTWLLSNKLLDLPLPTRVLLLARSASAWPPGARRRADGPARRPVSGGTPGPGRAGCARRRRCGPGPRPAAGRARPT